MNDNDINNHINALCRQASGLAPRFSDDNLASGCDGPWPEGPRQYRAFLRLREAFRLNATL